MKVLLFGATGNVGKAIAAELKKQGYDFTVVVRTKDKAAEMSGLTPHHIISEVTASSSLIDICKGFDVVISALGKSVSPNDKSKATFYEVDFLANSSVLNDAVKNRVKKFIYISALHSEKYLHLEYFRVHHEFSEKVKLSGLNYSIIKPPAIYSGFIDMIEMARKGRLVTIGAGDKKTNPIYEGDLAKICVDSIKENNAIIEAGGAEVYTRKELNEIIQKNIASNKKVRKVPLGMFKLALPFIKVFDHNAYDKFSFFSEVIQHDTLAPQKGTLKFEEYIRLKAKA